MGENYITPLLNLSYDLFWKMIEHAKNVVDYLNRSITDAFFENIPDSSLIHNILEKIVGDATVAEFLFANVIGIIGFALFKWLKEFMF